MDKNMGIGMEPGKTKRFTGSNVEEFFFPVLSLEDFNLKS